jgi:hypothetical protein
MTQDEIIEMLRASCDKDKVDPEQNGFWVIHTPELEAFAKLVAQHEREACAKVCDAWREWGADGALLAKAIRARENT